MRWGDEMRQQAIYGDAKTRGRARSPFLERYTRTIFGGLNQKYQKIPSELLPALRTVRLRLVRSMQRTKMMKTRNCPRNRGSSNLACSDIWEPALKAFEQLTVEHGTSDLQKQMRASLCPTHVLSLAEPSSN
jgi:hypothetical protein